MLLFCILCLRDIEFCISLWLLFVLPFSLAAYEMLKKLIPLSKL